MRPASESCLCARKELCPSPPFPVVVLQLSIDKGGVDNNLVQGDLIQVVEMGIHSRLQLLVLKFLASLIVVLRVGLCPSSLLVWS